MFKIVKETKKEVKTTQKKKRYGRKRASEFLKSRNSRNQKQILNATKGKNSEQEDKSEEITQHENKERKIDRKYREIK